MPAFKKSKHLRYTAPSRSIISRLSPEASLCRPPYYGRRAVAFSPLQLTCAAGSARRAAEHDGGRPRWHAANPAGPGEMPSTGLAVYCVILLGLKGSHGFPICHSPWAEIEVEGNGKSPGPSCDETREAAVGLVSVFSDTAKACGEGKSHWDQTEVLKGEGETPLPRLISPSSGRHGQGEQAPNVAWCSSPSGTGVFQRYCPSKSHFSCAVLANTLLYVVQ